jgi:hypothetical protein
MSFWYTYSCEDCKRRADEICKQYSVPEGTTGRQLFPRWETLGELLDLIKEMPAEERIEVLPPEQYIVNPWFNDNDDSNTEEQHVAPEPMDPVPEGSVQVEASLYLIHTPPADLLRTLMAPARNTFNVK